MSIPDEPLAAGSPGRPPNDTNHTPKLATPPFTICHAYDIIDDMTRQTGTTRAKRAGRFIHDNIGVAPLLAPLIIAGYYQADLATHSFGWHAPLNLLFPVAIEGGAAWAAGNYHRRLVAGDSTLAARLGMLTYAVVSGVLLYWHARDTGIPVASATAVGAMTVAALWIWTQRAKNAKRDILRDRGLIDGQVPRFSAARWALCPVETAKAFRFAVKYSYADPAAALSEYRESTRKILIDPEEFAPPTVEPAETPISERPHVVYEIHGPDRSLLYVGMTCIYRKNQDPKESELLSPEMLANAAVRRRLVEHRNKQPWADQITAVSVRSIHPNRQEAMEEERAAIAETYPEHNVQGKPKKPSSAPAELAQERRNAMKTKTKNHGYGVKPEDLEPYLKQLEDPKAVKTDIYRDAANHFRVSPRSIQRWLSDLRKQTAPATPHTA